MFFENRSHLMHEIHRRTVEPPAQNNGGDAEKKGRAPDSCSSCGGCFQSSCFSVHGELAVWVARVVEQPDLLVAKSASDEQQFVEAPAQLTVLLVPVPDLGGP